MEYRIIKVTDIEHGEETYASYRVYGIDNVPMIDSEFVSIEAAKQALKDYLSSKKGFDAFSISEDVCALTVYGDQ